MKLVGMRILLNSSILKCIDLRKDIKLIVNCECACLRLTI
jgi:hypothetical protein